MSLPINNLNNPDKIIVYNNSLCSICIDGFQKQDILKFTPCKHLFHSKCITKWLCSHNSCPNCRHDSISINNLKTVDISIIQRLITNLLDKTIKDSIRKNDFFTLKIVLESNDWVLVENILKTTITAVITNNDNIKLEEILDFLVAEDCMTELLQKNIILMLEALLQDIIDSSINDELIDIFLKYGIYNDDILSFIANHYLYSRAFNKVQNLIEDYYALLDMVTIKKVIREEIKQDHMYEIEKTFDILQLLYDYEGYPVKVRDILVDTLDFLDKHNSIERFGNKIYEQLDFFSNLC